MKPIIIKLKSVLEKKPSNAFLLLLSGFLFSQVMLVIILYAKHPFGGWVTSMGTITTPFVLLSFLVALSLCLVFLWRSVATQEISKELQAVKASISKTQNNYSPIDYPRGSTQAVVSGYVIS